MSISTISSLFSTGDVQAIASPSTQPVGSADANGVTPSGVTVDISKPGQLLSQLKDLAASDPAKFKAVTADIAQKLKDAASAQGGSGADFLNKLADRFSAASESGNASDLTPGAGQAHGHHHGHGGHHRGQGIAAPGQAGPTGAGSPDSVSQLVQGIISRAMGSASSG
jgi:hypothetical protein